MTVARGVIRWLAISLAGLVLVGAAAGLYLTRMDPGVEQAGRFVLDRLRGRINGSLTVADIDSDGLLGGVTLRGVELTDLDGRPFVRADSARLGYRLRTLLSGSLVFDRLVVHGLEANVERFPGQRWNYQRLFDTGTDAPTDAAGAGRLVLIRDITVHDGRVTVRTPWDPDADTDTSRLVLEPVPGGTVRTFRFDSVFGRLPRVVWEDPEGEGRRFEIDRLATRAHIYRTPLELRGLGGVVTVQDSIIRFEADRARLPNSVLSVTGQVVVGEAGNLYDLEAESGDLALRDLQWLYPALPDDGAGSLRFRLESQSLDRMLWRAEDVKVTTGANELTGTFGMVTGDTVYFTDVDLRAAPMDLDDLEKILPWDLPVSGLVIGQVAVRGGMDALDTRADLRYRTFDADGNGAESDVRLTGTLGAEAPFAFRDVEAELRSVDLAQVAQFVPDLRLRGVAHGTLQANGNLDYGVGVSGDLSLRHGGRESSIRGSGRFELGDSPVFDLQFDAQPVALGLLAIQIPALEGLRGDARGPVTVSGAPNDLAVGVDVLTPAGELQAQGSLDLTNDDPRFQVEGSVTEFRLDRVVRGLPETLVTGRFDGQGVGFRPESTAGSLSVDVLSASVADVEIYRATLRGRMSEGLARVDSFSIATEVGDGGAQGTFGVAGDQAGQLAVNVRADSLVFLEPALFPDAAAAELDLDRASRIDGLVTARGFVTGSLADWRTSGTVRVRSLVYDAFEVGQGVLDVAWRPDSLHVTASLDSLRHRSRLLAGAEGTLSYADGTGLVQADVRGRRGQRLQVESAFSPQGEVVSLGVRRLELDTRQGQWSLTDPAQATVGRSGFRVDSLVLAHAPNVARIAVSGVLPWLPPEADEVQEASLTVDLDSVRIGEFLQVSQTDTLVDGVVTADLRVTGTARQPRLDGSLFARTFRYGGATLDSVRGELAYADEVVQGRFRGWASGDSIVTARARVPLSLVLTDEEDRLLDRSMEVTVNADGVPAGLVAFLAPGFDGLDGRISGALMVMGTPVNPDLRGELTVSDGSARFQPLNVAYGGVQATARMIEGSTIELEASLATGDGRGRVEGTLDLREPTDPVFDLQVTADRLVASRRADVTAVVDGQAQVRGRYTRPVVSGNMDIRRGELNIDEIWRQYQIVQLDTTLFQMMDTTQVAYRPEDANPFLENLQVTDMRLSTRRGFWLRSQQLNVEVGGNLALAVDRRIDELRLTGTLQVVEGNYELLARTVAGVGGRRFDIRQGTIEFVGTPGIDPNLDIEAAYRVRRARGDPINVVAQVTGTLQDPRVELSSDADLPMSETDLVSYILFGRSSAELTQTEADVIGAGGLGLAASFLRPVVSGAAASGLQQVATSLGLPLDYVAFNLPEYGSRLNGSGQDLTGFGLLSNAQIEVGFDLSQTVSVIGSVRIPGAETSRESTLRLFGARVEYRPWETWTIEGFIEDQFARTPSFGAAEISDRKVLGFTFFREWGY